MATIDFKSAAGRLSFQTGMTDDGKLLRKSKTYQNVAKNVAVDNFYKGLEALASLSSFTLLEVERIDTSVVREY